MADTRMTMPELKATLPEGWKLDQNIDGRYLFWNVKNNTYIWDHPDPGINKTTYKFLSYAKMDPYYEALSYTWGSD